MPDPHGNNPDSTVAAPPPGTSGTTITLPTGEGSRFHPQGLPDPCGPFDLVACPQGVIPSWGPGSAAGGNWERMRGTRIGDVLKVLRAQYGTTAQDIPVGWRIYQPIAPHDLQDGFIVTPGRRGRRYDFANPVEGLPLDVTDPRSPDSIGTINAQAGATLVHSVDPVEAGFRPLPGMMKFTTDTAIAASVEWGNYPEMVRHAGGFYLHFENTGIGLPPTFNLWDLEVLGATGGHIIIQWDSAASSLRVRDGGGNNRIVLTQVMAMDTHYRIAWDIFHDPAALNGLMTLYLYKGHEVVPLQTLASAVGSWVGLEPKNLKQGNAAGSDLNNHIVRMGMLEAWYDTIPGPWQDRGSVIETPGGIELTRDQIIIRETKGRNITDGGVAQFLIQPGDIVAELSPAGLVLGESRGYPDPMINNDSALKDIFHEIINRRGELGRGANVLNLNDPGDMAYHRAGLISSDINAGFGVVGEGGTWTSGQDTVTIDGKARTTLCTTGTNVSDGDTVQLNDRTYRFKNTMAAANDVKIGASSDASLDNLVKAVNQTGTPGTEYFAGTSAPTDVTAAVRVGTGASAKVTFTATTPGYGGNSYRKREASSVLSWDVGAPSIPGYPIGGFFFNGGYEFRKRDRGHGIVLGGSSLNNNSGNIHNIAEVLGRFQVKVTPKLTNSATGAGIWKVKQFPYPPDTCGVGVGAHVAQHIRALPWAIPFVRRTVAGLATTSGSPTVTATPAQATTILTADGTQPANLSTVTLNGKVYRFIDTPAQINDILRAATSNGCLDNLKAAVNGEGGGVYFAGTTGPIDVSADARSGTGAGATMTFRSISYDDKRYNSLSSTSPNSHLTFGAVAFSGGRLPFSDADLGRRLGIINPNGIDPTGVDPLLALPGGLFIISDVQPGVPAPPAAATLTLDKNVLATISNTGYSVSAAEREGGGIKCLQNILTITTETSRDIVHVDSEPAPGTGLQRIIGSARLNYEFMNPNIDNINNVSQPVNVHIIDGDGEVYCQQPTSAVRTLTYGTTIAIDASTGTMFLLTVTNNTAFTISNPTNSPLGHDNPLIPHTTRLIIIIFNNSGGAMGAITWGSQFVNAAAALAAAGGVPANTKRKMIVNDYDPVTVKWITASVTADY